MLIVMLIVIVDLYLIIFDLYNMFIFNTVSSFVSITKLLEKQNTYSMQWMDAKIRFSLVVEQVTPGADI